MSKNLSLVVFRTLVVLGLGAAVWTRASAPVVAQSGITITSPTGNPKLKAGPDFATDILGDAWDFKNRGDVAIDPAQISGFSAFAVNGASNPDKAGGTAVDSSANFSLLQRAYYNILNPGRTGRRFPISSTTFTKLAFKMNASVGTRHPRVFWFHKDLAEDPANGDGFGWLYLDKDATTPAGDGIYVLDMTQVNQNGLNQGTPWTSGAVKGFSMYPNDQPTAYGVQFDWVRLTTGDSNQAASNMTITWTGGSGNINITVTDSGGAQYKVANGIAASLHSYQWNYGVLPPGTYQLNVGGATTSFTVNTPPTIQVTDPDETGGDDFATVVLNNPWDMNDSTDVKYTGGLTIVDHLISRSASGGQFTGTSDGFAVGNSGSIPVGDPQMYVLSNGSINDTTDIIDTNRYHRLTFSLQTDHPFDLQRGSVARVFWGSATGPGAPYNLTTTKDIITWPGMNTYSIDLAPLTSATNGGLEPGNATPWTASNVRHLRFDPHEFAQDLSVGESGQVTFHYGAVKLAADDETKNGSFTIKFAGSDADSDAATVALYYDTDLDPNNGKTLIASGIALAAGQYTWNTNSVPGGTYYIYAVASDAWNATGTYSTGPVKVSSFTQPSKPFINVDTPADGATLTCAFEVGGWALDQAALSGTGVDSVQFYIFPNDGADPPVFIGVGSYGAARSDVAAIFGPQFTNVGWHFTVTGAMPGKYLLGVYAHSTVTNSFSIVKTLHFTVGDDTLMSIDVPSAEQVITSSTLWISGWAIDRRGSSGAGTGVDVLHVYALANAGSGQAIFLGVASEGIDRPDVDALYNGNGRYRLSGYSLTVDRNAVAGLVPGVYSIVVWAHSTYTGAFNMDAVVRVTLQ